MTPAGRLLWCAVAACAVVCACAVPNTPALFLDEVTCMITATFSMPPIQPRFVAFEEIGRLHCRSFVSSEFDATSAADTQPDRKTAFVIEAVPPSAHVVPTSFRNMKKAKVIWMRSNGDILMFQRDALRKLKDLQALVLVNVRPNGLPAQLKHLVLRTSAVGAQFMTQELYPDFLRGGEQLTNFSASDNHLTAVPAGLFGGTPSLKYVDLSRNQLATLPRDLFASLPDLEILILNNNLFQASSLQFLTPLKHLRNLTLNSNPLGDLCTNSTEADRPSPFASQTDLHRLDLERTHITRICIDLKPLKELTELHVGANSISHLSCRDLVFGRPEGAPLLHIHLNNTLLHRIDCTEDDYACSVAWNSSYEPNVRLHLPLSLECDCHSYWLQRMRSERRLLVYYDAAFEGNCAKRWQACTKRAP